MNRTLLLHCILAPLFWLMYSSPNVSKQIQTKPVSGLCDSIPAHNREIIAFVDSKMHKKVGNGQCWTLAAEALKATDSQWDGKFKYGTLIDPKVDCIYPGDLIQFKNVKFSYKENGITYIDEMEQHTAVVYRVVAPGQYEIAHQNTKKWGKKVDLSVIDLAHKKTGKLSMYRPTKKGER